MKKNRYIPPHLRGNGDYKNDSNQQSQNVQYNSNVTQFNDKIVVPQNPEYQELCQYLVHGYIHNMDESDDMNHIIPTDIIYICYQFYMINDKPMFIILNDKYSFYSLNITSINNETKIQYLADRRNFMSTNKDLFRPTCYIPNICDLSSSIKQQIDSNTKNTDINAIYDGILTLGSYRGTFQFIFVFNRNRLYSKDQQNKNKSNDDEICINIKGRIPWSAEQFLFCGDNGVFYNVSGKLYQFNLQNIGNTDYSFKEVDTFYSNNNGINPITNMRMLYLSNMQSIFFIDNSPQDIATRCCLIYDLSKQKQTNIGDYKIDFLKNSCSNFKSGLCCNNVYKHKVFMVSNMEHISEYHIAQKQWINLHSNKRRIVSRKCGSVPIVWSYDYEPDILYRIQKNPQNFVIKCDRFDIRSNLKLWRECMNSQYSSSRFQGFDGKNLFLFL